MLLGCRDGYDSTTKGPIVKNGNRKAKSKNEKREGKTKEKRVKEKGSAKDTEEMKDENSDVLTQRRKTA